MSEGFSSADAYWRDQAQTWKMKFETLQEQQDRVRDDAKLILETFGARKRGDGKFDIDFELLAKNIGVEKALELRKVIDETWNISGAAGEKPKIRLTA